MKTDERVGRGVVRARLAALGDALLALLLSLVAIDIVRPRRGPRPAEERPPGAETPGDEHAGATGGTPER